MKSKNAVTAMTKDLAQLNKLDGTLDDQLKRLAELKAMLLAQQ